MKGAAHVALCKSLCISFVPAVFNVKLVLTNFAISQKTLKCQTLFSTKL